MLTLLLRVRYGKYANLIDRATEFILGAMVCFAGWTKSETYVFFVSILCCSLFSTITIKKEWTQFANPPISAKVRRLQTSFFVSFLLSFPFITVVANCALLRIVTPALACIILLCVIAFLWKTVQEKSTPTSDRFESIRRNSATEIPIAQLLEMDYIRRTVFPTRKLLLPAFTFTTEASLVTLAIYASNTFNSSITWPILSAIAYSLGKRSAYRPYEDLPIYSVLPRGLKMVWRSAPAHTSSAILIGIISAIQLKTSGIAIAILAIVIFSALYSRFIALHPDFSSPLHSTLQVRNRSIFPELFFIGFSFSIYLTILTITL